MWLVTGPFDGEDSGAVDFRKVKLLRTNKEYAFGRKGTPLLVNSKKISAEHGAFHVGEFDAEDATAVPTLAFRSFKKTFTLRRGESDSTKDADYVQELQDGDEIVIVNIVHIRIRWLRVCCYTGTPSPLLSECTSLGINLTSQPSADANYHLTPTLTATASLAASLISSTQFVKPEWLQDLVKLGDGAHALPSATLAKYRPKLAANLEGRHQVHGVWDPDEARLRIFRDLRFLCVGEKAREVPLDLRQMIARGDGTLESFDVHMGVDKFRQAISRGKSKEGKKLVVVGDMVTLVAAVGEDVLKEFIEEAKQSGLAFHPPDALVEAVLDTDTSKLETQGLKRKARSPSPFAVDEEPAPAPLRPKRLARREPSREPSAPPSEAPPSQVAQPQIVRLKRLKRNPAPDTTSILNGPPDLAEASAPKPPSITQATPGRPVRLKRRTRQGSAEPSSLNPVEETFEVPDSVKEPPLKRFKALFDASDPSNLGAMSSTAILDSQYNDATFGGGSMAAGTLSQTQMETMTQSKGTSGASKGRSVPSLSALREEEEESAPPALELGVKVAATRKRARIGENGDGDVDMDDTDNRPPAKRRATGASLSDAGNDDEISAPPNAQPRPTSKAPPSRAGSVAAASSSKPKSKPKIAGAAAGKPDEDSAFLKAVASTKRGKKKEDDFDREFNKLKISKPDLAPVEDEPEKEWAVLAEFGDDSGLRGNFMNIMEMEVFKERDPNDARGQRVSGAGVKPEWQGRPNFKKFKKKDTRSERPKIALFSSTVEDTLGPAYWKGEKSHAQAQPKPTATARSPPPPSDDEEQEEIAPLPVTKKRTQTQTQSRVASGSRAGSRARSIEPAPAKRTAARKTKAAPIVEESDEDEVPVKTSQRGRRGRNAGSQKSEALFLRDEDDEDEESDGNDGAFKMDMDDDIDAEASTLESKAASLPRRGAATKKAAVPVKRLKRPVKDDSDDDAVFKGF